MIRSGIRRFHKTVDKSKAKISEKTGKPRETNESTTIYGQVLIQSGLEPMNEAIEITTLRTKQFAKKQKTWFKGQHNPKWLNETNPLEEALTLIQNVIGLPK